MLDDPSISRILKKLDSIQKQIDGLEAAIAGLQSAYGRSGKRAKRSWLRPPMWTYEQYLACPLDLSSLPAAPTLPDQIPEIAIVTPSYNQARFLGATIDSILSQNYPKLSYHVQDGASDDETIAVLESYGDKISWKSNSDKGQSDAINMGFNRLVSDS